MHSFWIPSNQMGDYIYEYSSSTRWEMPEKEYSWLII
jgi:hypothetical protein